jgi:hypothetical protein
MSTTTVPQTLSVELSASNPGTIADCLRKVNLSGVLNAVEHDTGTITASATVSIPAPGALLVQSARVVSSGTAASVGTYGVGDSGATPVLPTGGASAGLGIATLSTDGLTMTFPNTVTQAVIRYIAKPATALTELFASASVQ